MTPINHYEGDRPKEKIIREGTMTPNVIIQCYYEFSNEIVSYGYYAQPIHLSLNTVAIFRIKYKQ